MTSATIAGGACAAATALLVTLAVRSPAPPRPIELPAPNAPASTRAARSATAESAAQRPAGFIYGRITDVDGATYQGRLRWGGDQEAFWSDYFNGVKHENRWVVHIPPAQRPHEERGVEVFGFRFGSDRSSRLERQFMARFGDIARVDVHFRRIQVALKSGMVVTLDRFEAGDIDDGVRVWDGRRGVVDLGTQQIRSIEFLPNASVGAAPERLHGTVHTRQGDFTGFVLWDRHDGVGTDVLVGRSADGERSLRYDTIRSIARRSRDSALVTLRDGRELVLSGTREVHSERGIYVDDSRYGRVVIGWDAFDRVDFTHGGSGPGYGDFPPGRPLAGDVITRDGRRLSGRLVFSVSKSETIETLDATVGGLDYYIPFSLIRALVRHGREGRAMVTLHDAQELAFERADDLGDRNAGMLVFTAGRTQPEYVSWTEVDRVDFDRLPVRPPGGEPRRTLMPRGDGISPWGRLP